MRNAGVPRALLRATVSASGPGPSITIWAGSLGSARDNKIVPLTECANVIVSAPWQLTLAVSMADRNVPGPELC
jgi:hypothetical protein